MRRRLVIRGRLWLQWGIGLAAAFALLQPALVMFDLDLSGWRADHGHLFVSASGGGLASHEHPYDHHAHDDQAGAEAAADADGAGDVVFLHGDDVTSTAIPAAPGLATLPQLAPPHAQRAVGDRRPPGLVISPASPPPRI